MSGPVTVDDTGKLYYNPEFTASGSSDVTVNVAIHGETLLESQVTFTVTVGKSRDLFGFQIRKVTLNANANIINEYNILLTNEKCMN